jgi:hypothetical protein
MHQCIQSIQSPLHFVCLEDPLSHFVVFASIKSNFWIAELGEGFWIFSKDYQVVISVGWFFEF